MRQIPGILIFLLPLLNLASAQNHQATRFDSLIDVSISLSEQALFKADFGEAERYADVAHFKAFRLFKGDHELKLTIQLLRIQFFKNILYQQAGSPAQTLHTLLMLGSIANASHDRNVLGDYFVLLSSAYQSTGAADSAMYYQNRALEQFEEAGNLKKIAQVRGSRLSRKHLILQAAGESEKVRDLIPEYQREIEFARQCDNKYVLAYNTRHLGQIYRQQTLNYAEAMRLFQLSLKLREEIGFKLFLPASYSSIGDVAVKMEQSKKAIDMYLQSITLAEEIGFVRYQVHPRIKLGEIYESKGDVEEARQYYVEAVKAASILGYEEGIDLALQKLEKVL